MTVPWLIGGYAFIVGTYTWVWLLATLFLRCIPGGAVPRASRSDASIALILLALWTGCWLGLRWAA